MGRLFNMIISNKNKYVYVATPKSGTHTMYQILAEYHQGYRIDKHSFHSVAIPGKARKYLIFTVVRNPYARMVSAWNSLTKVQPYKYIYLPLLSGPGFPDFAKWVCDSPDLGLQGAVTYRPQVEWVKRMHYADGSHIFDWKADLKRLKLEDIDTEIKMLPFWPNRTCDYKIPVILQRTLNDWRDCYTDELAARVFDYLQADFEAFGYDRQSYKKED